MRVPVWGAHMQHELAGIHRREKVPAEHLRQQP